MMLSYLKLAVRLLIRNPFFTLINVLGLAVGFVVFFVLWQYTNTELKSDRHWKDWERIKRLTFQVQAGDFQATFAHYDPAFQKILSQMIPELSESVRICTQNNFSVFFTMDHDKDVFFSRHLANGARISFAEHNLAYADPNLFTFFSIPLVLGEAGSLLQDPAALVLSEKLSIKYFGDEDPVGMLLWINDSIPLTVTGVFKNLPSNSHLDFEAVISMNRIEKNITSIDFANNARFRAYFKLPAGTDTNLLAGKIDQVNNVLCAKEYEKWDWQEIQAKLFLQPLEEIPFVMLRGDSFKVKSKLTLQIFQWIAFIVLMLAWINYTNLTLASLKKRTKEIAARRSLGAPTRAFIFQFVMEAAFVNLLAIFVGFTIFQILINPLRLLFDFSIGGWSEWNIVSFLWIGMIVIGGITVSGLYPALVALDRSPQSLLASLKLKTSENSVARLLTTTQFVIAIILVVWMFFVNAQVKYILNSDLGISKDQVAVVDLPYIQSKTFPSDLNFFEESLGKIPGVTNYATSSSVAGDKDPNGVGIQRSVDSPFIGVATNGGVDERFIPFYKIRILAGRNFAAKSMADDNSIILSRKAVELLGYSPEEAIGQRILVERAAWTLDMKWVNVIGIIADYNHQPLLKGFQGYWNNDRGIALTYGSKTDEENTPKKISIKIDQGNFEKTLNQIKELYEKTFHGSLFVWTFLDDNVNRHYENEKTTGNQILLFTCLAIGIASIGLLGMISNKVVEKTKEIGVRKVLGASVYQIARILLNTSVKQIVIATAIGIPAAYYLTQQYLEKFSQRVPLQWWYFALPVLILVLIMFATIASVLWKAARSNPVEALKYE